MKYVLPSLKSIVKCLLPLLKGLSPLVAPLKGLLPVAQGKWEPPLVPQIAAIVCLWILTQQTLPPLPPCTFVQVFSSILKYSQVFSHNKPSLLCPRVHLYKCTTVYCSFMLENLAVRFMLGSLVFSALPLFEFSCKEKWCKGKLEKLAALVWSLTQLLALPLKPKID